MIELRAYNYAMHSPTGAQLSLLSQFAGLCRRSYNDGLKLQQKNHAAGLPYMGYAAMCRELTAWRNSPTTAWMQDGPAHTQQQSLKDLDRAYTNFFAKRAAFPSFKKKDRHDSFRYPDPKQIHLDPANGRIKLPKLGWLRLRFSRPVEGTIKNVTVSQKAGQWFLSIQIEREVEQPVPQATSSIGVDVGVARFATFSDGSFLAPVNSFKCHQEALRKAQQSLSRKKPRSRNWNKAKARVSRLHHRIAQVRQNYLHQTSATLSNNHALVALEDLQVKNMSASATGTLEAPGKNVRAKSGLNKAILDQGWFEFRRQLSCKMAWKGGLLIAVSAAYTSQTCPECASISRAHRKSQAEFACVDCGHAAHAYVVGAINILARAHALLASASLNEGQDTVDASTGRQNSAATRIASEVSGAVRPPAAGTRRSDSADVRLSAVGILAL